MKKIISTLFVLIIVLCSFCQNNSLTKSYIYKTYEEYKQDKPSAIVDHEKGDVIKYSFPAGMQTRLKTKSDDVVTIYKPGDIWGYKEKDVLYRQFSNYKQKDLDWEFKCYFKVIYNKEVVIYSVGHIGVLPTENDYTMYYYSVDLNSDIKPINEENLNSDFPDRPEVVKLIKDMSKD